VAVTLDRQEFVERRFRHPWTPSRVDATRSARVREILARRLSGPMLDLGCYDGQIVPSVVGANQAVVGMDVAELGLLLPSLGLTLIALAIRPA
jgi:hypothetical protein